MSGRLKHEERSHKTLNKHYNEYRRRAAIVEHNKFKFSLLDRFKRKFKRQAKGDK